MELLFNEQQEIYFSPSKFEVRDAIKSAITQGVSNVCNYEQFLSQPEFEIYTAAQELEDHLFDEQNDLMSLAIGSEMLVRETDNISQSIDTVYVDLTEFAKQYEYFVAMYHHNVNFDVNVFREHDHQFIGEEIAKHRDE